MATTTTVRIMPRAIITTCATGGLRRDPRVLLSEQGRLHARLPTNDEHHRRWILELASFDSRRIDGGVSPYVALASSNNA